jgi:cytochrome c553
VASNLIIPLLALAQHTLRASTAKLLSCDDMKFRALVLICAALCAGQAMAETVAPPSWAYPVNAAAVAGVSVPNTPVRVPHSPISFLPSHLADLFSVPDWHPQDHPVMPEIVARGEKPALFACGYCHLANGAGRPENANLAGLPSSYIVQQVAAFKSGTRGNPVPERLPAQFMMIIAKAATDSDIQSAAKYFSSLPPQSRVSVIETTLVPHTHVYGWSLAADKSLPREPIGARIIELARDRDQFENRDDRTEYIAYVPHGSLKAGEKLAKTGGADIPACVDCHGSDLRGTPIGPRIAGRSPSYIVRQLIDIQSGSRADAGVAPMQGVVKRLSEGDMISIAAYVASLR